MRISSLLVNLALSFGALAIAVIGGEFALRINGIEPSTNRLVAYDFHPELGWTTRKNFKYYRSSPSYSHFNYYDADGLPTTASNWLKQADRTTNSIAIIGDSFAEGYYAPYEKTFAYLLGKRLHRQVLNLGVSGYAPDQYLLNARRVLPEFKIDTIAIMFFPYNDIPDASRPTYQGYAKPLFGDSLAMPVNLPLARLGGEEDETKWYQQIAHSSALYAVARPIIKQHVFPNEKPVTEETNDSKYRYSYSAMKVNAFRFFEQIRKEFPVPKFVVYYIPRLEEFTHREIFLANKDVFFRLCQEFGISCLSFDEALPANSDPSVAYLAEDGHFSQVGSEFVAQHLTRQVSTEQ